MTAIQPPTHSQVRTTHQTPSEHKRSTKRKTVHVTLWMKPEMKVELERLASKDGLSISKFGGTLLEEAIHQQLHIQHATLIQPIIEQAIRKAMRAYSNRLAFLLVRVAYASEQTRSIVTNILNKQPGITSETFTQILDGSSKTAKRNITERSPQLKTIITELEQMFRMDAEGEKTYG